MLERGNFAPISHLLQCTADSPVQLYVLASSCSRDCGPDPYLYSCTRLCAARGIECVCRPRHCAVCDYVRPVPAALPRLRVKAAPSNDRERRHLHGFMKTLFHGVKGTSMPKVCGRVGKWATGSCQRLQRRCTHTPPQGAVFRERGIKFIVVPPKTKDGPFDSVEIAYRLPPHLVAQAAGKKHVYQDHAVAPAAGSVPKPAAPSRKRPRPAPAPSSKPPVHALLQPLQRRRLLAKPDSVSAGLARLQALRDMGEVLATLAGLEGVDVDAALGPCLARGVARAAFHHAGGESERGVVTALLPRSLDEGLTQLLERIGVDPAEVTTQMAAVAELGAASVEAAASAAKTVGAQWAVR